VLVTDGQKVTEGTILAVLYPRSAKL